MKTKEISVKKREKLGKAETRKLRNEEMVPCVMYGGDKNYHFYTDHVTFSKLVFSPEVHLVELDMEGEKHKAIIQQVQFHPVTDKIIHIDFIEVFDDRPVIATIPIELTGSSLGVKNGGKMRQRRRYLKVKGLVKDLPERLQVDITQLDIGQVIKIGDLGYPNLEILDPHRSMIVSVVSSRVAMKGMVIEEEGAEEEAAEGEGAVTEGGESGGEEEKSE
ncbi:MAG: 50S ribosomal protein L25 [Bacteroidota bacterium]